MTEERRVIKVYESFVLGFCKCRCGTEIPLRTSNSLKTYVIGHHNRGRTGNKHPNFGKRSYNYKGGFKKDGYNYIVKPDHPNSNKRGEIAVHIYNFTVRNDVLFCCMLKWGVVHHKIPIKKGGSDELPNLKGTTRRLHPTEHIEDKSGRKCSNPECKDPYRKLRKTKTENWYGDEKIGWLCNLCYMKKWRGLRKHAAVNILHS